MNFKDLDVNEDLCAHLNSIGFHEATPIQEKVLKAFKTSPKSDLIALAQTGTGKTAAFGIPLIEQTDFSKKPTQALVLSPTRELCVQISKDLNTYAQTMRSKRIVSIYGGTNISAQIKDLQKGAHIIVATPGRCLDLLQQKKINLSNVKFLVLDEADEMLNMGFKPDLDKIIGYLPSGEYSTWLFSATMSKEVRQISSTYMNAPMEISVGSNNATAKNLEHFYFEVNERDRYLVLKRLLDFNPNIYGLVFCRTKLETDKVANSLIKDGYNSMALHGDLSQKQRDAAMNSFRNKTVQILVATDVAARGLDVDNISHVIHYKIPDDIESYTHRSGRTARAGKSGVSLALINHREKFKIKEIEKKSKTQFQRGEIPSAEAICEKQLMHLIEKIKTTEVESKTLNPLLDQAARELKNLSADEIIQRLLYLEFQQLLNYYKTAKAINVEPERERGRGGKTRGRENTRSRKEKGRDRREQDDSKFFQKFFLNMGKKDNINKSALIRTICDQANITSKSIGRVTVRDKFSFVDIIKSDSDKVFNKLKKKFVIDGKDIKIESANK